MHQIGWVEDYTLRFLLRSIWYFDSLSWWHLFKVLWAFFYVCLVVLYHSGKFILKRNFIIPTYEDTSHGVTGIHRKWSLHELWEQRLIYHYSFLWKHLVYRKCQSGFIQVFYLCSTINNFNYKCWTWHKISTALWYKWLMSECRNMFTTLIYNGCQNWTMLDLHIYALQCNYLGRLPLII